MTKLLAILLIIFSLQCFGQIVATKGSDNGVFLSGVHDTTVVFKDADYSYIAFVNCTNIKWQTPGVINMTSGISYTNAVNVKRINNDSILINQHRTSYSASYAIAIEGYSSDIELGFFSIKNAGGGIWCKNEKFCDPGLSTWVFRNISIHDFVIDTLYEHGSYIGATGDRSTTCNGIASSLLPTKLANVSIFNGTISNTGKNNLMINDCDGLTVHDMKLKNPGLQKDSAQGQNLAIGRNTKARVWNIDGTNALSWNFRYTGNDTLILNSSNFSISNYDNAVIMSGTKYFASCGNTGKISVDASVPVSKCGILPVKDPVPQLPPAPEYYNVKVFDFMGRLLQQKQHVIPAQFKLQLTRRKYLILQFWNDKNNYTEKIFKP